MFALEVDFHDGVSPPETILVRRSNAIIGSGEMAHVVIEGGASGFCELRLVRGLGRQFCCLPVRRTGQESAAPSFLEGDYLGEAMLQLGEISLNVLSLDIDLLVAPNEFPDRAALRIFRSALSSGSPEFPTVAVIGTRPTFISFQKEDTLLIGRSRDCGLRLDSSDVSGEHARVGIENGQPWVEDLASTNGTFVGEERVSGRRFLKDSETFRIGSEFSLAVILAADGVSKLATMAGEFVESSLAKSFPCVVSQHETVRPKRYPLRSGVRASVGRDPANDIWISAAHISRHHLEFLWDGIDTVSVTDFSSNGTFLGEQRMERNVPSPVLSALSVFDFSSEVKLGLCFSEEHEDAFLDLVGDDNTDWLSETIGESQENDNEAERLERYSATLETDYINKDFTPEPAEQGGVFERLVSQHANRAQNSPASASEYFDSGEGLDSENSVNSEFLDTYDSSGVFDSGVGQDLNEFEQYQRTHQLGPEEFNADYNLLSQGKFDEDFLEEQPQNSFRSVLLVFGVVGLVILILAVCIAIFTSNHFY